MRLLILVPCLVVAILVHAGVVAAQAKAPATTDSPAADIQHRVLLASLSAYTTRTRNDAQAKLLTMGDSVEPGLVLAAATARDDDARQRARSILDAIRTQRRIRQLMEPTRVTLHFDHAPVRDILASLYIRAGGDLWRLPPDPWGFQGDDTVTVHLDGVAFWDAISKLEELTGLTLTDAGWGARFERVPGELRRGRRVCVSGPFRVVAEDGPMPGSIASLKVFLEPKLKVLSHAQQARLLGRDDEHGKPLAHAWLDDRRADERIIGRSGDVLDVQLPFAGLIQPIAHFKGTIPAVLIAREELIDVSPFGEQASVGGRTFSWKLYIGGDNVYLLRIYEPQRLPLRTPDLAPPPGQQRALPTVLPDMRLMMYDAHGVLLLRSPDVKMLGLGFFEWTFHQRLPEDRRAKRPGDKGDAAATAPASAPAGAGAGAAAGSGAPARMTLALPTMTRTIEIPFEFGPPPAPPPPPRPPPPR
jgi:hypothetical protein